MINHRLIKLPRMNSANSISISLKIIASLFLLAAGILTVNSFSIVSAQSLVPGIHGMSIVEGVKFTWVIISSDKEISVNLRHLGNTTTPPITIVATALTSPSQTNSTQGQSGTGTDIGSGSQTTTGGSQVLNAGWISPNSLVIKIEGNSSLYDADIVTVVASQYTGG
jgi:hypothetical protein